MNKNKIILLFIDGEKKSVNIKFLLINNLVLQMTKRISERKKDFIVSIILKRMTSPYRHFVYHFFFCTNLFFM